MAQVAKALEVTEQTDHFGRNRLDPQLCTNQQVQVQLDPHQYMFINQSLL